MLLSMFLILFRKVDLSLKQLEQWRRKWVDVSIFWQQLQIGLREFRKSCLNLFPRRWLIPSLSLVSNLIPLGLWHLKTLFPEGLIFSNTFSWRQKNFLSCVYFAPACSIQYLQKGKTNFGIKYVLLWTEEYY